MTEVICILDRSGVDVDNRVLASLSDPLLRNGGQLVDICSGPVGVGIVHRSFDTGPVDQFGPLVCDDAGSIAVVSGRMHGIRAGPCQKCDAAGSNESISPARAFHAYAESGLGFLNHVAGSFVFLAVDPRKARITVARDHLGGCKLYYFVNQRWVVLASDPTAILRHASVSNDIDEGAVARFLGFQFSHTSSSFYRDIKELAPAHSLQASSTNVVVKKYWRFSRSHDNRESEEIKSKFLEHVRSSLRNSCDGVAPDRLAVSMSGGLDSTLLAALSPAEALLFSWYFDDSPECDERKSVEAVGKFLKRNVNWIKGDGLQPFSDEFLERFVHKGSPYVNPFSSLKAKLYSVAREAGCRRILVGDAGDALYGAQEYWLRDLILSGQRGWLGSLARTGKKAMAGDRFALLALRRLVPIRQLRASLGPPLLPWLNRDAHRMLPAPVYSPILPSGKMKYRYDLAVGAKYTEVESEENLSFARYGIERCNPFWYWPLLEMVVKLPAWWFYRDEKSKVLTREASRGLLPERVRASRRIGQLGGLYLVGLELNKEKVRDLVFNNNKSDWKVYVDRSWVENFMSRTNQVEFGHTILWRVISYELWYRRVFG